MRIGFGYDSHRLVEGRKLILGGVNIPFESGLLGHSDADVLTHAVIDAILGAAAKGDIGRLFPDTDPAYKDINSMELLDTTLKLCSVKIINLDCTVIAQRPRLAPFIEDIRESLAKALGIDISRVCVKAKTDEGLDAVGRGEAMKAMAVVLLEE